MENTWKNFLKSGSVEDYLKYRMAAGRAESSPQSRERAEGHNAGLRSGDGDDYKDGAYRGI